MQRNIHGYNAYQSIVVILLAVRAIGFDVKHYPAYFLYVLSLSNCFIIKSKFLKFSAVSSSFPSCKSNRLIQHILILTWQILGN